MPSAAIDPSRTAALAVRPHTARATSGVNRASAGWFINAIVLSDTVVRHEAEERRLLELHRESLSERTVEHRVAGRVGELGEYDGVLVGERRRTAAIDHARDSGGDDDCGRADREPPRAETPERRVRRHRSAVPVSQTFEIGAQVGGVLIAERAISLQAFRDDAFQLRRLLDAQPDGRRGPGPLGHFVEDQAEAPDVGAMIDGFAAGLLRRHVGDGSDHHALARRGVW